MIGFDYSLFWNAGRAILEGTNPYALDFSWYPPAATLFFALIGLLPFSISYFVWTFGNLVCYFHTLWKLNLGRAWWAWLFFTPFLFVLLSGQLDIILFWAASFLIIPPKQNSAISKWSLAVSGAFLTIKPQLAVIVLPWFIFRWLQNDRMQFFRWGSCAAILHLLPLIFNPGIYLLWIGALQGVGEKKTMMSGGLFALGSIGIPDWVLWTFGGVLMIWGLFQKEPISRSAQLTSFPISAWYDMLFLLGNAPVWLMVPLSWLALCVSYITRNNLPMVMIPFGTLIWGVVRIIQISSNVRPPDRKKSRWMSVR